jgi:hypothetical protein
MKTSYLKALIEECLKEELLSDTDPIIAKTWERHKTVFLNKLKQTPLNIVDFYEAYEQGFIDGVEAEKKQPLE